MIEFSNGLTRAEEEMLVITGEEGSELTKACSKIWRHGKDFIQKDGTHNMDALEEESADVMACLAILVHNGFLDRDRLNEKARQKLNLLRDPETKRVHHITPDMLP